MSVIDQKRIAKNTLLLYVRMGVIMLISLYTSRVVLEALGEVDFGIYNTVGSVIMMLSFVSSTMSAACQRFFAYELGRNNQEGLKQVFNMCITVFAVLAFVIVLLSETAGHWLILRKIDISGQTEAAKWVMHTVTISVVFTILRIPYQGMVIIKEKMKVFTYISIFEAVGNLSIALIIANSASNLLILYAILMMSMNAMVSILYFIYCIRFYPECKYRPYWDKSLFKSMFSFAGWNLIGSFSGVCKSQGLTILLNMFFGNAVVSARSMAYKVYSTIQQFSDSFMTAMKPQIMKSYSSGDTAGSFRLVLQGTKFSFFLLYIISLPILLKTTPILDIWLKDVPDYTVIFTRLIIINSLIDINITPLGVLIQADGRIKLYHSTVGVLMVLVLPIAYLLLKFNPSAHPATVFAVSIMFSIIAVFMRLLIVRHHTGFPIKDYFVKAILPVLTVASFSFLATAGLARFTSDGIVGIFIVCVLSVLFNSVFIGLFGLTKSEKIFVFTHIKQFFSI